METYTALLTTCIPLTTMLDRMLFSLMSSVLPSLLRICLSTWTAIPWSFPSRYANRYACYTKSVSYKQYTPCLNSIQTLSGTNTDPGSHFSAGSRQ